VTRSDDPPALGLVRSRAWGVALLFGAVLIAYLPVFRNGWVWEDAAVLTGNPLIKLSDGLARFWLTTQPDDYWPVSSSSLWLEWRVWGLHALPYHLTNLALHLGACVLLWRVLERLKIPGALIGALLFAVHPVNVESVAWIAQRKNLLGMIFFLLSILFFLRSRSKLSYGLSLLCFVLAMLSKGSVAPLPLVLAGIILWPRTSHETPIGVPLRPTGIDRSGIGNDFAARDWLRLAPFFAVAIAFGALNVWFQTHGLHGVDEVARTAGPLERILEAAAAIWFYLGKALFPVNLMLIYPQWTLLPSHLVSWLPLAAAIGATAALWRWWRTGFAAWAYFCIMLIPALGLTDVGFMKFSLVADHYQHLALVGVTALAGAEFEWWRALSLTRWASPRSAPIPTCALALPTVALEESETARSPLAGIRWVPAIFIATLATLTFRQCLTYRDSATAFSSTLARNAGCWLCANNLGNLKLDAGDFAGAADDFRAAIRIKPDYAEAENNLGTALSDLGRAPEAQLHYEQALRLKPDYAGAEYGLGTVLLKMGRTTEGLGHLARALRLRPLYPEAHGNLGVALAALGRRPEAIVEYERALSLRPDYPEAHFNLGLARLAAGELPAARDQFEAAVQLRPDYGDAIYRLAGSLAALGQTEQAVSLFQRALHLDPTRPEVLNDLGCAYLKLDRISDALAVLQQACRLPNAPADAPYNLGIALARAGRFPEAAAQFQAVVTAHPDDADSRLKLAAVLVKTGQFNEAQLQRNAAQRLLQSHATK